MSARKVRSSWRRVQGLYRDSGLDEAGIPHGVTTSALGDMKEPALRRAAAGAAGLDAEPLLLMQEHGVAIHEAAPSGTPPPGDGWICAGEGLVPAVFVADCLPIFIWDERGSVVGVFHAGWKGLASGMGRAAVRAFRRYGIGPERLAASVGPHVGRCCYAVGPEVAARFGRAPVPGGNCSAPPTENSSPRRGDELPTPSPGGRASVLLEGDRSSRPGGSCRLDLGAEARAQLVESGIPSGRVSVSEDCTACLGREFFSFRRDKADRRMLAFIARPRAGAARP